MSSSSISETGSGNQPLAGKTLVVTGTIEGLTRGEVDRLIKSLGGKTAGSVSRNTDFVVVGDEPGKKAEKAKKLGVATLDQAGFFKLIGRE